MSTGVRDGVTIGVLGGAWRGVVSDRGAIEWGAGERLDWWVAADDRWHDPQVETSLRQERLGGVPVVETRLRVPQGDVVQRVFAVADSGGLTIVEFENTSPMPVAIALNRRDLLTTRPPTDVAPQGIELPPGAAVHPLAHRATLRFAIAHSGPTAGAVPSSVPPALQVVRGWTSQLERGSRVVLPEPALADALLSARADVALEGLDDPADDPVAFLLGVHEMVRLGADPSDWIGEIAGATEAVTRLARRDGLGWDADRAMLSAASVFRASGEPRAVVDTMSALSRLGDRRTRSLADPGGIRTIAWIEDRLLRPAGSGSAVLMADGFPVPWLGVNFECHQLPASPDHVVSFAVRWHGERPAVLWEITGPSGLTIREGGPGGSWRSSDPRGEALLSTP